MKRMFILFVVLTCRSTESFERERMVVWNVGQGSWATYIDTKSCDHFDVGGDSKVPRELSELCFARTNRVFISHSDWDHISHMHDIYRSWNSTCVVSLPRDLKLKNPRTQRFLEKLTLCPNEKTLAHEIAFATPFKRANDLSRIYEFGNWLFPGDSTAAAEKVWSQGPISKIKILVLGHHGSRTSTSNDLLDRLPHLQIAIASARFSKYGHPHQEVRERLKRRHIPLLITEEWGNLVFEL